MPDQIAPEINQVWKDNDKRSYGRLLRIVDLDATHATVELVTPRQAAALRGQVASARPGRRTRIRMDRLRPTTTGYRLVQHADGRPVLPEAVIFDVDGTLCDVRSIRHLIESKGFDAFHRASASCPPHPHVVQAAHDAHAAGQAALVVTGRVEKWRRLTSMWLALHQVPSDGLWMRPDGDFRKDYVIKKEILRRLRTRYDIVHAWDDQPAICQLWREEGIAVSVVPGWDGPA